MGWGGGCCWGHPCSEPCSPTRPSIFLAPHQATNQKHNRKFPISLSVLKPAAQTSLHPLWKAHLWVAEMPSSRSSSPLQDVGYVVLSLHVVVQGNMCRVALGHGAVQGGTSPKRVASLYVLQRSRSLHSWSQFSSKASPANPCLVRQVRAQVPQLCAHSLSSARVAAFLTTPDAWRDLGPQLHSFYLTHRPSWQTTSLQPAQLLAASSLRLHG